MSSAPGTASEAAPSDATTELSVSSLAIGGVTMIVFPIFGFLVASLFKEFLRKPRILNFETRGFLFLDGELFIPFSSELTIDLVLNAA